MIYLMSRIRKNSNQGLLGGKRNRYREQDSNKRYTTDPDLIQDFADKCDVTFKDAKFLLDEFIDSIRTIVDKNGAVTIRRLGTFYLKVTKRSKMFIPRTGSEVKIPLRYKIAFTPTNSFKNAVNSKVKSNLKKAHELKEGKDETR